MNPPVFEPRRVAGHVCRGGGSLDFVLAGLLVSITAGTILFPPSARAADEKTVLVMTQGNGRQRSFIEFTAGLQQNLMTNLQGPVVVYVENLDFQHFSNPDYQSEIVKWLRVKYEGRKLDAIVGENEQAADIAFKVRAELWPQVPLIFVDSGRTDVADITAQTNFTSLSAHPDVRGTLEAALRLCPDTRHIAYVSSIGNGYFELYQHDLKRLKDFAANRFEIIELIGLTLDETRERLATLPPQTIVFYNGIWFDATGQFFTTPEALDKLSPFSSAPIFGCAETHLDHGIVGGSCRVYYVMGMETAGQVAAVIRAGNASSVPARQSKNSRFIFDWRQLRRFGLNPKNLPPGSDVMFRPPTLWETYREIVIIVAVALAMQTGLIAALLLQRRRKRQAKAELFNSQQMLLTVLDTIPERVFWKDRNSVYLGCNKSLAEDCGYSNPSELIGKTDNETASAPMAEKYRADDREVMETNRPKLNYREQQSQKDGGTRWLKTNKVPLHDKDGRVIGMLGTYEDITELMRAEEAMRESEQRLRTLAEASFEGVCISENGRILDVNDQFAAMLGYEQSELIGREILTLVAPESRSIVAEAIRTDRETSYENQLVRKDGGILHVETQAKMNILSDHRVRVTVVRDLTERRQLEEQLRQSQKMEAFGQLAGGVAHDFNNLLTIIEGHVALLQLKESITAEQAGGLAEISKAAERAANLTRQLLTFSRRQLFQPKPVDLNDIVANTTKMLQRLIGEHIGLETHFAPGGAPITADRTMMEQILINLAVNSRDAMSKGGRLIIQTTAITISETDAAANPKARPGAFIRLSVTDTGCGIAPKEMERIFEPFFTTKEVGKGTGLGLATVFGIVTQHHGWIEVKSNVNEGATFHIHLPRLAESKKFQTEFSRAPEIRGGNETILLVEDEAPVRSLARTLLERKGYHIIEADSGLSALEIWQQQRDAIDLLFTDMVMPAGISGRELAARLLAEKPGLKVIYSSGYTDDMLGENSPLRNNPNFLEKPFNSHKLLKQVRDCLDGVTGG